MQSPQVETTKGSVSVRDRYNGKVEGEGGGVCVSSDIICITMLQIETIQIFGLPEQFSRRYCDTVDCDRDSLRHLFVHISSQY